MLLIGSWKMRFLAAGTALALAPFTLWNIEWISPRYVYMAAIPYSVLLAWLVVTAIDALRASRRLQFAAGGIVAAAVAAMAYYDRPSAIVSRILIPKSAPPLRDVVCKDWSFTDTNIDCSFVVSTADFPALLDGHAFKREAVSGSSDALAPPKLGHAFELAERYSATPKDARRGGELSLWTDRQHRNVRLSYWVE